MAESYSLTQADVDGCREILAQLEQYETKVGAYTVGTVQGHQASATATVRFDKVSDPFTTAEAVSRYLASAATLALVCRKLITHCDSHPEAVASRG